MSRSSLTTAFAASLVLFNAMERAKQAKDLEDYARAQALFDRRLADMFQTTGIFLIAEVPESS